MIRENHRQFFCYSHPYLGQTTWMNKLTMMDSNILLKKFALLWLEFFQQFSLLLFICGKNYHKVDFSSREALFWEVLNNFCIKDRRKVANGYFGCRHLAFFRDSANRYAEKSSLIYNLRKVTKYICLSPSHHLSTLRDWRVSGSYCGINVNLY